VFTSSCPGLFYPVRSQDGILTRIRTPGGLLNVQQANLVAELLKSNQTVLITNRANLQLRSVVSIHSQLEALQAIGLAGKIPEVDHLRNIMLSPTAGIDVQAKLDSRPIARQLDEYISGNIQMATLSAKFSIGIDAGESVAIRHRQNDIWLVAIDAENLRLVLGSDTGIAFPVADTIAVVEAIALLYAQHAAQIPSRETAHRRSPKPRLRDLIQHRGMNWFVSQLQSTCTVSLNHVDRTTPPPLTPNYQHLGIHPQEQSGLCYVGVVVTLGQIDRRQLKGLATIAETYGSQELRLTPWQNVIIPGVLAHDRQAVSQALEDLGLSCQENHPAGAIVACSGRSGCAAAHTDAQDDARMILQGLTQRINIHVSGCAKACAQPFASDIALMGVADGEYEIYSRDGNQPFGQLIHTAMPAAQAIAIVEKIVRHDFAPPEAPPELDYIRDGSEIYAKSFATIRSETTLDRVPADLEKLVVRLIHACGMTDIVDDIAASPQAGAIGRKALAQGAKILCDAHMVADGVTRSRLPADNAVICTLRHESVPERAKQIGNTRSAAALELWLPDLAGSIVAIGNAPTALFRLLEMIDQGAPKPALILGFPVGFVGAAESKAELASNSRGVPFITLHGRRGGSALAAAAVNALAQEKE
jgi:ferredoxin-nitrite reductase